MRKVIFIGIIILFVCGLAQAAEYTFTPIPGDLQDLNHDYAYAWGESWSLPAGETITGATLTIYGIENWAYEPNANWLYMHLADVMPAGGYSLSGEVKSYWDVFWSGDFWGSTGSYIATYTDNAVGAETISYDFAALGLLDELTAYTADGNFALLFDPDCHFNNCGVEFKICTQPVPEPASILGLIMGCLPLAAGIRGAIRRKQ